MQLCFIFFFLASQINLFLSDSKSANIRNKCQLDPRKQRAYSGTNEAEAEVTGLFADLITFASLYWRAWSANTWWHGGIISFVAQKCRCRVHTRLMITFLSYNVNFNSFIFLNILHDKSYKRFFETSNPEKKKVSLVYTKMLKAISLTGQQFYSTFETCLGLLVMH